MTQTSPRDESEVESRRFRYEGAHRQPQHAHQRGQIVCITSGVMNHETGAGVWILPKNRLVWTPPGVPHGASSRGIVEGWLLLLPSPYADLMPTRVCILRTSRLLTAALERLTEPNVSADLIAALVPVILFELERAAAEELQVPLPRDASLRDVAQQLIDCPTDGRGVADWARAASMSTRSFTRHFKDETGMPFAEWKRRVVVRRAVEMLALGESVSNVAVALGYESVSAFTAMFRRLHGVSPKRFMAGYAEDTAAEGMR